jgi:hypothetical protein
LPGVHIGRGFPPLSPAWGASHSAIGACVKCARLWVDPALGQYEERIESWCIRHGHD